MIIIRKLNSRHKLSFTRLYKSPHSKIINTLKELKSDILIVSKEKAIKITKLSQNLPQF
jgi:hypothetical protein